MSVIEQQLQTIFTSALNEAVVPVEDRFVKEVSFLPKSLSSSGFLDFDLSYFISYGFPLNQSVGLSDIIG